jgi:hypothetical protein
MAAAPVELSEGDTASCARPIGDRLARARTLTAAGHRFGGRLLALALSLSLSPAPPPHLQNVLLVDDSIVRGTTSKEIVQMARDAGAAQVFFSSAAPPVRFPNVYGIDIPTKSELIANGRNEPEIARIIDADWVVYQCLDDLKQATKEISEWPQNVTFEASVFDGKYVTGDIGEEYFASQALRKNGSKTLINGAVHFLDSVPAAAFNSPTPSTSGTAPRQSAMCDSLYNRPSFTPTSNSDADNLHQTLTGLSTKSH